MFPSLVFYVWIKTIEREEQRRWQNWSYKETKYKSWRGSKTNKDQKNVCLLKHVETMKNRKKEMCQTWIDHRKLLSPSDPHQVTFYLTYVRTFHLAFYLAYVLTFHRAFYSAYILTFHLALSGMLSGILIGILSAIYSHILSGIYSDIRSDILSGIYFTFSLACMRAQACSTASRGRARVQVQASISVCAS